VRRPFIAALLWLVAGAAAAQDAPCPSLDACREAVATGEYAAAEAGLERLSRSAEATLLRARVMLETGRYAEAAELARPLARAGGSRIAAGTLLGEAELRRGRLDEAQRALSRVASEPEAHRARLRLGQLLIRRGRAPEAQAPLMALIAAYNDESISSRDGEGLAYVGQAAALLDSPHDANDAFGEALRADPRRVETHLDWAELFLAHYDTGQAAESVRAALAVNPNSARARTLLARILLEDSHDFVGAQAELDRALATNPNQVSAHVTRAAIAIRDMDLEEATRRLDQALAIDPNDLEALSVRAVIPFLRGDDRAYRAALREVFDRNPRYSEAYSIIADYADWEHRYPRIVEMARDALRIDPDDARAHATLGINLLRMGREEEGLDALRAAWDRDRFNVRVYNLLELWDNTLTPSYERFESGPFVFRMHREERAVMEPTASAVLGEAWADMRRRYRFTPRTPVHVELFSDNQTFSVRTAGLPNVGVQGVCFGQVVTALSPRAGPFNWAQITWHELAHVFHIQLSDNRVPRWFTEGLAEYETMIARPEWRREQDHRLYRALAGGRLPPVSQLNHAFTHARTGDAITVAYYASSMLVAYIVDTYGFDRVPRMLRAWGQDRTSAEVVQQVLGVSIDQLDLDFRSHTQQRLAGRASDFGVDMAAYADLDAMRAEVERRPDDPDAHAHLAAALMINGASMTEAMTEVRAALRRDADNADARMVAANLAFARRDYGTARADLRRLFASGHDGYEPRLLEARVALAQERPADARRALERASQIDPERHEAWQGLSEIAEQSQDEALRLSALRRLVELDQHDRASNFALLTHLAEQGDWTRAREYGERAPLLDPFNAEARRLYAEALIRAGEHRDALAQVDLALAAEPQQPARVHLTRARALMGLNRRRQAREAADAAVAADPSLADEAAAVLR